MCPVSIHVLFIMETLHPLFAEVFDLLKDLLTDTASTGTPPRPSVGVGRELRYPPLYSVEEYIILHLRRIDGRWIAITRTEKAFAMRAGNEERETAFVGWFKRWKN